MSSLPPPPPPPPTPPPTPQPAPPGGGPTVPQYGAPQPGAPAPPPKSGMSGCAVAALVIGALVLLGIVGTVVLGAFVFDKAAKTVGKNLVPHDCPVLSNDKARQLFGKDAEASTVPLAGLVMPVFDDRVLSGEPVCWVTNADKGRTILIHHTEGGDAHARFQKERDAAQPTSEDRGNGLTVESTGYFDKDVAGLGDEAFCTGMALNGATGVLVRTGNRLVYVTVLPSADEFDPSQMGTNDKGVITNDPMCEAAQTAARGITG